MTIDRILFPMRPTQLVAPIGLLLALTLAACGSGTDDSSLRESPLTEGSILSNDPFTPSIPDNGANIFGPEDVPADISAEVQTFTTLLEETVVFGLVDLNEKLQSGVQFSDLVLDCLSEFNPEPGDTLLPFGGFDPAIGNALQSFECNVGSVPLENGVFPLFLFEAGVTESSVCGEGLLSLDGTFCNLSNAQLFIPAELTTTEFGLPIFFPSGIVDFDVTEGTLNIANLPGPITGGFNCSFDLQTGFVTSTGFDSDCVGALNGLGSRVQVFLDRLSVYRL